MPDFRQIIKDKMKLKGISIGELARMTGLNPMTIYKYFWGGNILQDTFCKILDALDLELVIVDRKD